MITSLMFWSLKMDANVDEQSQFHMAWPFKRFLLLFIWEFHPIHFDSIDPLLPPPRCISLSPLPTQLLSSSSNQTNKPKLSRLGIVQLILDVGRLIMWLTYQGSYHKRKPTFPLQAILIQIVPQLGWDFMCTSMMAFCLLELVQVSCMFSQLQWGLMYNCPAVSRRHYYFQLSTTANS